MDYVTRDECERIHSELRTTDADRNKSYSNRLDSIESRIGSVDGKLWAVLVAVLASGISVVGVIIARVPMQ